MKYLYILTLICMVVYGCSTDNTKKISEIPVQLKTSNVKLKLNFDSCLTLTQRIIKQEISDKEFSEYFSLNKRATGFEYDNEFLNTTDTLFQLPNNYHIFYDFIYENDTIGSFRADFDSALNVIYYRNFHLTAFRKFIDKKFLITRTKATLIAIKNGMVKENLVLILNCSEGKFYWECKNDCNECLYLEIDAKTGEIIKKGKTIWQY